VSLPRRRVEADPDPGPVDALIFGRRLPGRRSLSASGSGGAPLIPVRVRIGGKLMPVRVRAGWGAARDPLGPVAALIPARTTPVAGDAPGCRPRGRDGAREGVRLVKVCAVWLSDGAASGRPYWPVGWFNQQRTLGSWA